jgi:putative ABC transport system permease protein
MKLLPLVWKNIWRRKIRTIFTLLSVFIAFLLFGILMTVRMAFTFGVDVAGLDRLVIIHKVSLIMPLPLSYGAKVQSTPGVEVVAHSNWFGGVYQDPSNFFAQMAVSPQEFFAIYKEFKVPPDQMQALMADRQGAIVGVDLAKRFNWKIGDRIPLTATIYQPKGGGQTWEFNIVGFYDGEPAVDKTQFFFRYDYLTENSSMGEGQVGWYIVKVSDPSNSAALAKTFDDMFANSSAETKTTSEKSFVEGFAKQVGDIGAIMIAIVTMVMFTLLLVAANTMAQSVRERTNELAVLKTLGFQDLTVLRLVLAESLFIVVLGGGLGLALAWLVTLGGDPTHGLLPVFMLPVRDLAAGVALMVAMGLIAGAMPAISAMRLRITDALRRA